MNTSQRLRHSGLLIAAFMLFGYLPAAAAPLSPAPSSFQSVPQTGAVVINEFLASNQNDLTDEDGDHSDWLELYNPDAAAVDLTGWSLSDNAANPGKWVIPARILPPNTYLVIFASGKNRAPPSGELHTNFSLSAGGEYLGLYDNATPRQVVDEFAPGFPQQYGDVSYGRYGVNEYRYYANPTPGAVNDASAAYLGVVSDVEYSIERGYYPGSFTAALSSTTPGAAIRHTRSSDTPSPTVGTVYNQPVSIYDTLALRAIAYRSGYLSSNVNTHTYIMPHRVVVQPAAPAGFPATWGTFEGQPVQADYQMDPDVVNDPRYSGVIQSDLRSLPAVSIVTDRANMFGESTGIYSNPLQEGRDWERPTSVEMINSDGSSAFQLDAGVRIHGSYTRRPDVTAKHSFRLYFRSDYGPSELEYPLFPDTAIEHFNVLVLRANLEDTFMYDSRALYVRDQVMRDTQQDMGQPNAHGIFVHLYVDGLYWGVYNLVERLDEDFAASYFGGAPEDFDVVKPIEIGLVEADSGDLQAWNAMIQIADAGLANNDNYQAIQQYLDVPNLIDYMLVHIYAGTFGDWYQNWVAIRKREAGAGFQFFVWDNEYDFDYVTINNTGVGGDWPQTPAYLYSKLRENAEFRLLFADHVQRHFYNSGVFYVDPAHPQWDPQHPERNVPAARIVERLQQVDRAVVPESARWGDWRYGWPYTRDDHWVVEQNRVLTQFFPQRSGIVMQQLHNANLYPAVAAPAFNQHGGSIPAGFQLTMTAPAGTIYFTTDGSDPRVPVSGAVSPSATAYTTPVPLPGGVTEVKARALNGGTWSALTAATFTAPLVGGVIVNEVLAHTDLPLEDAIELHNPTADAVTIGGWFLSDSADTLKKYRIPDGTTVQPGGYAVFYEYQFNDPANPPNIPFALSSQGEEVYLASANPDGTLTGYTSSESFGASANGVSFGRFATSTGVDFTAMSRRTFGVDNPATVEEFRTGTGLPNAYPLVGPVVINELMYNPLTGDEFLELQNITDGEVLLYDPAIPANGWALTDGVDFTFPPTASVPSRSRALVVPIDPETFRVTYSIPLTVPIYGPYIGALSNGGETIEISRPDEPDGAMVPYIAVDAVTYDDAAPWPLEPDGTGPSLARLSPATYGNDSLNWQASSPGGTPGRRNAGCLFADIQPNAVHTSPATCDTDVDVADIQRVAACWNQPIGTASCPATLNVDGLDATVTVGDLIAVATRWNWPN